MSVLSCFSILVSFTHAGYQIYGLILVMYFFNWLVIAMFNQIYISPLISNLQSLNDLWGALNFLVIQPWSCTVSLVVSFTIFSEVKFKMNQAIYESSLKEIETQRSNSSKETWKKFDEDNLARALLPGNIKDVLGEDGVLDPIRTTGNGKYLFNAILLALTGNGSIQISLKLILYTEI